MDKTEILTLRDRIVGMFLGVAIGDALGMPVEMMSAEEIKEKHGRVTSYLRPDGHKWFNGRGAGEWTDDWLFTMLIAKSITEKGNVNMDDIAEKHLAPYREGALRYYGCGSATRKALKKLSEGCHWSKSGTLGSAGNGIVMKIAPIAAYYCAINQNMYMSSHDFINCHFMNSIARMTHNSNMAVLSGKIHCFFLIYLLAGIFDYVLRELCNGRGLYMIDDECEEDDLPERMMRLFCAYHRAGEERKFLMSDKGIISEFGQGSAYVYNSLPFSYAFFLRNQDSIETLYDVVSAGGDTDTNGSIVGSMLGAKNGVKIFPEHLINGLWRKDEILKTANDFCDKFEIE